MVPAEGRWGRVHVATKPLSFGKCIAGLCLVLGPASSLFGQLTCSSVLKKDTNYICDTTSGKLANPVGPDPLLLNGATFTAIAGVNALNAPVNPGSSATYNNVTLSLSASTAPITLSCSPSATATVTASSGGDTFAVTNCPINLLGSISYFTTTFSFAGGLPSPIPLAFNQVSGTGTASYICNNEICFPYLTAFVGGQSDLNDVQFEGSYTGTSPTTYCAVITSAGSTDQFTAGNNPPACNNIVKTPTNVLTAFPGTTIQDGVDVYWKAATGHTVGDYWTLSAGASTSLTITNGEISGACFGCGTLTLTPPTSTGLTFNYQVGGSVPSAQTVTPSATATLSYTVTTSTVSGGSWLSATPTGADTGTGFAVSVNPAGLSPGTYMGSVSVYTATSNSPQIEPVTLNVTQPSFTLTPSPTSFTFNWVTGQATPTGSLAANTTPSVSVPYSATVEPGAAWLSVNPSSGTTGPGVGGTSVNVTASPTGLTGGTYNGNIDVSATGATNGLQKVPVTLKVNTVSAGALTPFSFILGGSNPTPQSLVVTSVGPSTVTFTASASTNNGGSWLSVSSGTFTAGSPTQPSVSVNGAALTGGAGTYTGTINVLPAGATTAIPVSVTLNVTAAPSMQVSPSPLTFSSVNGATPGAQTLTITSSGASSGVQISYTVAASSTGGWLQVSPASGTTPGSEQVTISSSVLSTLATGSYSGSVVFTATTNASPSTVTVPVTLNVTALLSANPNPIPAFSFTIGGTAPSPVPVTVTSDAGAITYTAVAASTTGGNWLAVSPAGNTTTPSAAGVTASVNTAALTTAGPGTYTGTITLASPFASNASGQLVVPASVTVLAQPTLTVSTTPLTFTANAGGSNPNSQMVPVTSSNGNVAFTVSTMNGGSWLSVLPASGTTNSTTLTVSANISGLAANTYTASIIVTAPGALGSPATIPVTLTVGQNVLSTLPSQLSFSYQVGGAAPTAQNLTVNSSGTALTFTAASTVSWLSVTPGGGTTPGTVGVSVNTAGLTPGTYTSANAISISANNSSNSPLGVTVTLTVTPAPPLVPTPTTLSFLYQVGGSLPGSQPVSLATGNESLPFTATPSSTGNWLGVTPTSGTTPGSISVSVNPAGLNPGTYGGTVTVVATGSTTVMIPVTLTVAALTVNPTSLTFNYATGGTIPPAQSVAVAISSGASVSFSAAPATTSGGPWLLVNPTSGATPSPITVSVTPSSLGVGTYNGTITVSSNGFTSQVVNVTLIVTKPKAIIDFSGGYQFSLANTSTPVTNTLTITASDGSAQAFTIAAGPSTANWLTFSPNSGTTPATIKLTASPAGLAPGVYPSPLLVTAPGTVTNPTTIPVSLTITGSNLAAVPPTLSFTFQPGGAIPPAQTLSLTPVVGNGPITLTAVGADVPWLKVSQAASAPATITVTALPSLLTPATYSGDVTFTAQGSPGPSLVVPVTLTVNALPQLSATPAALSFDYQIGGAVPAPQSFALSAGAAQLSFSVTPPGNWLQVSPARGTTPGSVLVTANPAGLVPGTYGGTITATAYGASDAANIAVTLIVSNAGQLEVTPTSLSFAAAVGGAAPAPQMATVLTGGAPVNFTATASAAWLTVTPASGVTPEPVTITANPAGLQNGTYVGSILIAPAVAAGGARGVSAATGGTLVTVLLKVGTGIGAGAPTIAGVINAASGVIGTVSPGMAISIFGTGLGPQVGAVYSAPPEGGTVATALAGTEVLFDGSAVPLLYTQDGQVNALVPFDLAGKANTVIQVSYNGQASAGMQLKVAAAEPGLFTANGSGAGQGAILNHDGSENNASHPAVAGRAIELYGTGGGVTVPPSIDGSINPLNALGKLALNVTVTIGGQPATVEYYGPAPGLVAGVIQVNAVVPVGTPSGPANVVLTVGNASSQTVTAAVQ